MFKSAVREALELQPDFASELDISFQNPALQRYCLDDCKQILSQFYSTVILILVKNQHLEKRNSILVPVIK